MVKKIYKKNLALFLERYPKYTFFLPNINPFIQKRRKKDISKSQSEFEKIQDIDDIETVYVYGLDFGERINFLRKWITKKRINNLVFIEDDLESLLLFLASSFAKKIILEPKIHLFFKLEMEEESSFLDEAVSNFFSGKMRVFSSFSLKEEQKRKFESIKSQIIRFSTYHYAIHMDDLYSHLNFANFLQNLEKVPSSFFVNLLKDKFKDIPAIICGAGPSLYEEKEHLKKLKTKAFIIAGGSAIPALLSYGIKPHLGVVIDPNLEEVKRMKKGAFINIPIVYSTRVHRDVFKYFGGPLGYISSVAGGTEALFFEERFKLKQEYVIGQNLSREAFSVTTLNLELAHFFGCSPIIFCGVDLAYRDNKRYCPGVLDKESKIVSEENDPGNIFVFKKSNLVTMVKWEMEADVISKYKKDFHLKIFNSSKKGLKLSGIDFVSLKEMVKKLKSQKELEIILEKELKKVSLNISKKEIESFQIEILLSLKKCKKLISEIKNETKELMKSKKEKYSTPLMILAHRDLKEEIAYNYFLSRPKVAIMRYLENYHRSFSKLTGQKKLRKTYDLWNNLEKITLRYLKRG